MALRRTINYCMPFLGLCCQAGTGSRMISARSSMRGCGTALTFYTSVNDWVPGSVSRFSAHDKFDRDFSQTRSKRPMRPLIRGPSKVVLKWMSLWLMGSVVIPTVPPRERRRIYLLDKS